MRLKYCILSPHGRPRTTNGRKTVVGLKFGRFAAAINILRENRKYLDLSSVEFDGSHTPAKNGRDAVGYQGRKACKTTKPVI